MVLYLLSLGCRGVIHLFCCWKVELKLDIPRGEWTLTEERFVATESRRDPGEPVSGDREKSSIDLSDAAGEARLAPLRTWHVGQSLTKREMSSLGTLSCGQCRFAPVVRFAYHEYTRRT